MIYQERLLKILISPHVSEKTSILLDQYNIVVFKVKRYATKLDIERAICMLFSVKIRNVSTVIIAGKIKGSSNNNIGYRRDWKKAYVMLEKGCKIDFIRQMK